MPKKDAPLRGASFFMANLFLEDYLDDIEDIYLSEQVLAEIRSGKQRTYSADEVFAEAGL